MNLLLIIFGKIISKFFRITNFGNGSTWPGHIALGINKNFISEMISKSSLLTILIAGTNGKTTTARLIRTVLETNRKKILQNQSGANLLNGIASALILNCNMTGNLNCDYAIFEVDENVLPHSLKELTPNYIVLLNLFRDQLDRYGEVQTIAKKWKLALEKMPSSTTLILNADDPQIAFLGKNMKAQKLFFGLNDLNQSNIIQQHAADSIYCPNCGTKLNYKKIFFSHLGDYSCNKCKFTRPRLTLDIADYPLPGLYNRYNILSTVLLLKTIGLLEDDINQALKGFTPAFGRQELIIYKRKKVQLFLSKNPTSFNQSYTTIKELEAKTLILALNDRIPDGRDISWIWDVDLPGIEDFKHIIITGDRVYDMALRIKYEGYKNFQTIEKIEDAVSTGIDLVGEDEKLFILPTYSAMLEVRKILTGRRIL